MTEQRLVGANAAQLRDDIDKGRTGDKTPGFDPAAAPLGTDDEAGGVTHSPEVMAEERERALRQGERVSNPNAASPGLMPDGN